MRTYCAEMGLSPSFTMALPPWAFLMIADGKVFHWPCGPPSKSRALRAVPIFHLVFRSIGASPGDLYGVYVGGRLEVHNDPLRMQGVAFSGEFAGEIRIAFPVAQIRALHRAVAVGGEAAMWQGVGEDVASGRFQFGAAGEITAEVSGIAPGAVLGPVPGSHA